MARGKEPEKDNLQVIEEQAAMDGIDVGEYIRTRANIGLLTDIDNFQPDDSFFIVEVTPDEQVRVKGSRPTIEDANACVLSIIAARRRTRKKGGPTFGYSVLALDNPEEVGVLSQEVTELSLQTPLTVTENPKPRASFFTPKMTWTSNSIRRNS